MPQGTGHGQPSPPSLPPRLSGRKRSRRELHCHLCDRVFHKNEHLNRHVVSHTKEKHFRCRVCPKVYSRRDSLLRHARIHTDEGKDVNENNTTGPSANISSPSTQSDDRRRPGQAQDASHRGRDYVDNVDHISPYSTNSLPMVSPESAFDTREQVTSDITIADAPDLNQHQTRPLALDYQEPAQPLAYNGGNPISFHPVEHQYPLAQTPTAMPSLDYWGPSITPWLLGGEFDFTALNNSITASLPNFGFQNPTTFRERDGNSELSLQEAFGRSPRSSSGSRSIVEELWITRPTTTSNAANDLGASLDQDQLDENYRNHLSGRLKPSLRDGMLPPAKFLNLCIKLFFTRFNPVFRLIHSPTFRPSSENALLVISICSIGALFVGTTSAAAQGREIFLRLNKAILASWETYVYKRGPESLHVAQAVVLGQTFGMLSGNSNDLLLTNSFHGTIISWARQVGMFRLKSAEDAIKGLDESDVHARWKAWVQAEETIRVVAGLYIHDCEFTTIFHTDPFLRHGNMERLPQCCSDELFGAPSATSWQAILANDQGRRRQHNNKQHLASQQESPILSNSNPFSYLRSYVSLSSITASISEARRATDYASQVPVFSRQLQSWFHDNHAGIQRDTGERASSCLKTLWHEAFIILYTDMDFLEMTIGRDRIFDSHASVDRERTEWNSSQEAIRAVLHAYLNFKFFEKASLDLEPAIHVPKTLFHSGLVIYSFLKTSATRQRLVYSASDFVDSEFLGVQGLPTAESCYGLLQSVEISTVPRIVDILRRLGHWEISRRMALILEALGDDLIMKLPQES